MDWKTLGMWIGGIIAALTAAGFVIKIIFVRKSSQSCRIVKQNNNNAGRDIIGGDKIDKR